MVLFFTFVALNFDSSFSKKVTLIANIIYTVYAGPFKGFVFGKNFKLMFSKVSTAQVIPFSAVITGYAVTVFRDPCSTGWAETGHLKEGGEGTERALI